MIICLEDCIIYVEQNFCVGKVFNLVVELMIDNCVLIDIVYQVLSFNILFGIYYGDFFYVVFIVVDIEGNIDICVVELILQDIISFVFVNCFELVVIVDVFDIWCSVYVNFFFLLVEDNCVVVFVIQIDDIGLIFGDFFFVGIIVMIWEVVDNVGNLSCCDVKVVVNDYYILLMIICIGDVIMNNDLGDVGVIVENIVFVGVIDNCGDNLMVIYCI